MPKVPSISDAEWTVMRVLWDKHPLTSQEIVDAIGDAPDWNPRTIKTMLNRLVKKTALGFETDGNRYLYFPKVRQEECVRDESHSFLTRVFGGAVAPMLAHFVEDAALSEAEIAELKKILARKKGE